MAKLSDAAFDRALFSDKMAARGLAQTSGDDDPEDAARSLQLSSITGVPADVINPDVDSFEKLQRQMLSADIVGNDMHLQDYIRSNSMHSKISNDDWGKMGQASEAFRQYRTSTERSWPSLIAGGVGRGMAEGGASTLDAIGFLTGSDSLRNVARKIGQLGPDMTESEQRTISAQVGAALGGLIDIIPAALLGGIPGAAVQMGLMGGSEQARQAEAAGKPEVAGTAFTGGFATGAALGALPFHLLGKAGGIAAKAAVGAGAFAAAGETQEAVKQFLASELYNPRAHYEPQAERIIAEAIVGGALGPFFRHGEKPPLGADKIIDKAHKALADENAKAFDEVRQALSATATAQRSPDALFNFLQLRPGKIGITTDAFGLIYGPDEVPRAGDGKLGDVPGVVEGFPSGKEVWVNRADFLVRVKPELIDEIKDDLVHTDGGISKNEGKELPSGQLELPFDASPAEQVLGAVRQAAGLHELGAAVSGLPKTTEELVYTALTKEQRKLVDATEAESEADIRWIERKAEDAARKRQTKKWVEKGKAIASEVREAVRARSDVMLTEFLENGRLQGRWIERAPRLKTDDLTPEQQTAFAGLHSAKGKYSPDSLARIFQYPDGASMLRDLAEVMEVRRRHGLGRDAWVSELVGAEIEARLEKEFGPLEGNIVEEARAQAVGPTVLERVHAEYENMGTEHGLSYENFDNIKQAAKAEFDRIEVGQHSVIGYLKQAGKNGRLAQQALIDGKPSEALIAMLHQIRAMHMANLAVPLEKARAVFERNMRGNAARQREGYQQDWLDRIHSIMGQLGRPVKRTVEDLNKSLGKKSLQQFVDEKTQAWRSVQVADMFYDSNLAVDVDKMSTEDFMAAHNTVLNLMHNARADQALFAAGLKMELAAAKSEAIQSIERLKDKVVQYNVDTTGKVKAFGQVLHAGLITAESLVKRIEKAGGPMSRIVRWGNEQAASEKAMHRTYGEMVRAIEIKDPDAPVENPGMIFGIGGQQPLRLTRANVIRLIMNMGTKSNLETMIHGEAQNARMDPEVYGPLFMAWIKRVATKDMVDAAQAWMDIHSKFKKLQSDPMEMRQSGITVEEVPAIPMVFPFGKYKGGYVPLVYDSARLKLGMTEQPAENNYVRAATPQGYTVKRTGYYGPIDLHLEAMSGRLTQMIHDAAFREWGAEASKLFFNNDVQNAFSNHMGVAYRNMMKQWVEDVMSQKNFNTRNGTLVSSVVEALRVNLIASLIGFNPGTVMKHGGTALLQSMKEVGSLNFWREVATMNMMDDELGNTGWRFVKASSDFMAARSQNWIHTIGGANAEAIGKMGWRQYMAYLGSRPVAWSDQFSSIPTWLAAYKKNMREMLAKGVDHIVAHEESVPVADTAVRNAHGDTSITNRPEFMRQQGMAQWLTSLYGFFNHIFQRHYEMAWRAGEMKDKALAGDIRGAMADIPYLTSMTMAYVIAPAVIEELVTPFSNKERESWGAKAAKVIGGGMASSVPIVRDVAHAILGGHDPSLGLMGSELHAFLGPERDLTKKDAFAAKNIGHLVESTAGMAGALTGFPLQVGHSSRFVINYMQGREHPQGIIQGPWTRERRRSLLGGLWHGTTEQPRR